MRLIRLLRLAAQAEALRWKRMGRGYAIQAVLAVVAAAFALMLLLMLHVAALVWLSDMLSGVWAALIVAFVDLVITALLGLLAARRAEDPLALEAERVRDDALRQVGDQAARAAMLAPLLRTSSVKKGLLGAALTAAVVGLISSRR
jgi:hypothetical protein